MDRPPRKQPRVRPRDFAAGMPIVQRAWDRGLLTERQLVTAVAVGAAPEAVALPPLLAEVLRELLTARHVEAVERARLWPARSGRAILALLLDAEADARSSSSGAHGAPTDG